MMNMRDMPIDEHDIRTAWDSEGSLVMGHTGHGVEWVISINNTDFIWIRQISEALVARGYHPRTIKRQKPNKRATKPCYRLYIGRIEQVNRFLNEFPSAMPSRAGKIAEFREWYASRRLRRQSGGKNAISEAYQVMEKYSRRLI